MAEVHSMDGRRSVDPSSRWNTEHCERRSRKRDSNTDCLASMDSSREPGNTGSVEVFQPGRGCVLKQALRLRPGPPARRTGGKDNVRRRLYPAIQGQNQSHDGA